MKEKIYVIEGDNTVGLRVGFTIPEKIGIGVYNPLAIVPEGVLPAYREKRGGEMMDPKQFQDTVKTLLEEPVWPTDLKVDEPYSRTHDDCDGEVDDGITVAIDFTGDVWVKTQQKPMTVCRYRTHAGGGRSLRVRNALLILALAIKADNEAQNLSQ